MTVVERVAQAREQAQEETHDRGPRGCTPQRCGVGCVARPPDVSIGMSRSRWLSTEPVEASAPAVKAEVEKLGFLRALDGLGAHGRGSRRTSTCRSAS